MGKKPGSYSEVIAPRGDKSYFHRDEGGRVQTMIGPPALPGSRAQAKTEAKRVRAIAATANRQLPGNSAMTKKSPTRATR